MLLKPVDTAIIVTVGPLIDDNDFKALETTVPWNAAGMSVDLFEETYGAVTKTDLTLTTGGTSDWTHIGNGVYEVEITAAQNNTEGILWVVGICDGVLVFESPRYAVVSQPVYDALAVGTDVLPVNAQKISGDSAAADALETMLDGTGGNVLKLKQLLIVAEGNDSAIDARGLGTGAGFKATGGATGDGTKFIGGATSGHGLNSQAQNAGSGILALAQGNTPGLRCDGEGTGAGIAATGGGTGGGLRARGGSTSGHGIDTAGGTSGSGIKAVGTDSNPGIWADIMGTIIGDLTGSVGSVTNEVTADVTKISGDATAADDLELLVENSKGTDHKVLISTDAQDLNASLDVNTKTITNGAVSANAIGTDAIDADALKTDAISEIRDGILDDATRFSGADIASILTDTGTTLDGKIDTIDGNVDSILTDTAEIGAAGGGLTDLGGMSDGMKAEVESEANDALVAQKLDHLVAVADADDVADSSIIAKLASKNATPDWSTFDNTTDALEALRDYTASLVAPSVVVGTSMSGNGFLSDAVSLVRQMTDEPSTRPKYTNTDVVNMLQVGFSTVLTEVNINTDHPILVRHDITLVSGTLSYILPPQVGEIWRVAKIVSGGYVPIYEVWPDNHQSAHQSGFVVEGNVFRLLTDWHSTDTLQILFVPLGEPSMHYGTAGASDDTDGLTIPLADTPTDGTLDTRANAYAGYLIRILTSTEADESFIQERTIVSYNNVTRVATVSPAFDPTITDGTITYEVIPAYSELLKHVVCMQVALNILGIEGNEKRMKTLNQRFAVAMRALKILISKKCSRFPGHMEGDTSDNDYRGGW